MLTMPELETRLGTITMKLGTMEELTSRSIADINKILQAFKSLEEDYREVLEQLKNAGVSPGVVFAAELIEKRLDANNVRLAEYLNGIATHPIPPPPETEEATPDSSSESVDPAYVTPTVPWRAVNEVPN